MSSGYKKFNGKLYEKEQTVWSKKEAQNVAKRARERKLNARIIKAPKEEAFNSSGEAWIIYVRRSKRN